ncbi:UbiA family prenyltransferase [Alienimonas chondri]|uniref:Protoheme IX farnesyltransferase n=1 Tax=Alienimonas chondri TaxID=2681879 RepID=A0ABX1V9G8_9PLAN|nr:UbiA family prenyltransferase [Alienimonas chondri]NNJ24566.1 Protoheme IX farnesyltransferase [Alienimonas chondri]
MTKAATSPSAKPAAKSNAGSPSRVRPWLRLVRLPALFTAPADVLAGFSIVHSDWTPWQPLAALVGSGVCLYAGGMVLNDWFDRTRDAAERSDRPIPAGEINPKHAAMLGFGLLIAGVALGFLGGALAGNALRSGLVASAVALFVLLYDGPLKRTLLACPTMGACRATNLILGASALPFLDHSGVWTVALAMGCYVGGVTLYARSEATTSDKHLLTAGFVAVNLGFATLAYAFFTQDWVQTDALLPVGALAAIAFSVDQRLAAGLRNPAPNVVGPAVGIAILSIITLDAFVVMAATQSAALTLATAALLAPAALLKRVASIT